MAWSYGLTEHHWYINLILDGKLKDTYESIYDFDKWERRSVRRVSEKFIELGWDEDFIEKKFRRLRDEHLECHQVSATIYYFAYIWIYNTKSTDIYDILRNIGMTDAKAREIKQMLEPLRNSVFTDRQLILMKLKVLLKDKYYRVLSKRGKDISVIKELICPEGYKFYYLPTTFAQCKQRTYYFSLYQLRFKGTDFTDDNSLYLYDNLDFAIEVCRKLSNLTTSGIIVYQLPIDIPDTKYLEIDEWFTTVCKSRRLKCDRLDHFDDYDFIHGRICANPNDVYNGEEPIPRIDAGYQLVLVGHKSTIFVRERCIGAYVYR
jgi:hypothetical protein